ncbi:MAG: AAA family ATPase [Bacteroidetes bacterium]|nr:AAA family ATPase [Bacteroidota bacterium]
MQINLIQTNPFWAAVGRLPSAQQSKIIKFLQQYPVNPQKSSFNFEKIQASSSDQIRSLRLDQKYRIIAHQEKVNNTITCLHVDVHDAAYDWAQRHRFEKNKHTGVYQTILISESSDIKPKTIQTEQGLFHKYRDRQLLRLGVPEEQLDLVRSFQTINDLNQNDHILPDDVWVVLSDLASGTPYENLEREIIARANEYDDKNVLDHPENKRQFVSITDKDLEKMMDAPLSEWRIYLHPSQDRIVKMNANGPIRVLGGAGTGKTVVAMHRAHHLASNVFTEKEDRILFLVFNRNLAADISANLKQMCTPDVFERIEVDNVDSWVVEQAGKLGLPNRMTYFGFKQELDKEAWKMAIDKQDDLPFSEHFIRDEFDAVVAAEGLQSRDQYLRISRRGRGTRLTRTARRQLWDVFEAYRGELRHHNIGEPSDVKYQLAEKLRISPSNYRSVVVDEVQDMSKAALQMIRAIVPEGSNDLLLTGDAHQRIYGRRVVLSHCNINIRGRSRRLRINYRTPERVRNWAIRFLEGIPYDDLDGDLDTMKGYTSLIQGDQPPTVCHYETKQEELESIISHIEDLAHDPAYLQNICLVAPSLDAVNRYEGALMATGIKVHQLKKNNDNSSIPGVRLATMHRVKGLEYDHIIVASVNKNLLPLQVALRKAEDEMEKQEIHRKARSLLYVACTRARKTLFISSFGKQSSLIKDIVQSQNT